MEISSLSITADLGAFIFENLPDGLLIVDSDGKILYVNKTIQTMLDYSAADLIGQKVEILMPARFHSNHIHDREEYTKNPKIRNMGTALGIVALKKGGQEVCVDIKLTPLQWNGRQVYASIIRNVEHIKILRDSIHETNKKLEETVQELKLRDEEKNALLGMAAHDLRNPLGNICSLAELILGDEEQTLKEENELFIKRIAAISTFMLTLVTDVLSISALESSTMKLNLTQLQIETVIREGLETWNSMGERKGIQIDLKIAPGTPPVQGDLGKLHQVLDNLVSNAIKYSPKASKITIEVHPTPNQSVRIAIQDQGPGISRDMQHKLFRAFSKVGSKTTGGETSTGLGLAIVKKIVEAHRGRVWVESELGVGSTFFVEVPTNVSRD